MAHVIYKLTSPSGKVYIGRTNDYKQRMAEHKTNGKTLRRSYPIYKAINKHGWENFKKEIIATVETEEDAILAELLYIEKYNTVKEGYNCTDDTHTGGNVWSGREDSEEMQAFKEKMSEVTVGEMNGMYGKNHKNESISKMKEKAKGRFSLPWYIDRYGEEEGTEKYHARCKKLSERKMQRNKAGQFTTHSQ